MQLNRVLILRAALFDGVAEAVALDEKATVISFIILQTLQSINFCRAVLLPIDNNLEEFSACSLMALEKAKWG